MFRQGAVGLAATGFASLTLNANAAPTDATADVHDYQAFLDTKGVPKIAPAGKWSPSHEDILGPFFLQGAPFRGKVTQPLEPGELLVVRGRVWGFDTKKPIANAVIDVWQADAHGKYDLDDPRKPPSVSQFRNRIRLVTDETGFYEYETIRPASYQIGPQRYRPAHIHYMVQARGYAKLVTQLYFKDDKHLASDPWASKSNLIIDPQRIKVGKASYQRATFDIVLASAG
jgi:protocatechuate 3,4-dioxygenase beta subunit